MACDRKKTKDHSPPKNDPFIFCDAESGGRNPSADREGRALRKVQEQGSAGVQGQSLAGSKAEPGGSRAKPGRVTDEMPCPSR